MFLEQINIQWVTCLHRICSLVEPFHLSKFSVCLVLKRRLISNEADSAEFCLLKWLFKYEKRFWIFLNFSHILFTDFSRLEKFVIADKICVRAALMFYV